MRNDWCAALFIAVAATGAAGCSDHAVVDLNDLPVSVPDQYNVVLVLFASPGDCASCMLAARDIQDSLLGCGWRAWLAVAIQCEGWSDCEPWIRGRRNVFADTADLRRKCGLPPNARFAILKRGGRDLPRALDVAGNPM
jgi:hypothetical protein